VGSYLCVFFWILAFGLMDQLPEVEQARSPAVFHRRPGMVVSPAPAAHSLR
jgi:hypothetical protein